MAIYDACQWLSTRLCYLFWWYHSLAQSHIYDIWCQNMYLFHYHHYIINGSQTQLVHCDTSHGVTDRHVCQLNLRNIIYIKYFKNDYTQHCIRSLKILIVDLVRCDMSFKWGSIGSASCNYFCLIFYFLFLLQWINFVGRINWKYCWTNW